MKSHFQRLVVMFLALVATVVAVVLVQSFMDAGETRDTVTAALLGVLATLAPGFVDSFRVELRRRTPGKKAVEDDVDPEGSTIMKP